MINLSLTHVLGMSRTETFSDIFIILYRSSGDPGNFYSTREDWVNFE